MPLEGAYLYTDHKLSDKPYAVLGDGPDNGNGGIPYALVYFGDAHLRIHSADAARAFIVAFAEAVRMLESGPAPDAVKQVRELLPKTTLHEPAPFTSPDLVIPPADLQPVCSRCDANKKQAALRKMADGSSRCQDASGCDERREALRIRREAAQDGAR
jgi:hypothetical protein